MWTRKSLYNTAAATAAAGGHITHILKKSSILTRHPLHQANLGNTRPCMSLFPLHSTSNTVKKNNNTYDRLQHQINTSFSYKALLTYKIAARWERQTNVRKKKNNASPPPQQPRPHQQRHHHLSLPNGGGVPSSGGDITILSN